MSDSTYTKKLKPDLKMPNNPAGTGDLGIRYHGPVLTGLLGVNQQLERQAVSSPQTSAEIRRTAPGGVQYLPPPESIPPRPDPRLDPDPVLAAQRHELGNRPEVYDPVLRHHLGLPPAPDPYEQERRRAEHWRRRRDQHLVR